MLNKKFLSLLVAGLFLGACASNKAKDAASDPAAAKAVADAKPGSPGPGDKQAPVMVGPDVIAAVPVEEAWKTLSDVENWGAWNSKVTAVKPGAGLNTGTELQWKWEERGVSSTVVELKENELLLLKGCRTGSNVSLRWTLSARDKQHCLVSLRALLKPGANQTLIANASNETQAWMEALQGELAKKAAAMAPPPPAPKKTKKPAKKAS
jgi:hypothetical protein